MSKPSGELASENLFAFWEFLMTHAFKRGGLGNTS